MYKKSEKIKAVIREIKDGKKLYQATKNAGIGRATWYMWEKAKPRLKHLREMADKLCEGTRIGMVEDALFRNALAGNVAAQIFFLKNRKPDSWRDKQVIESLGPQQITQIYLPDRKNGKLQPKETEGVPKSRIDGL